MRNSAVLAVRRSVLCALSCAALSAALPAASAAAPQPREASRVPFAARYQAVQHGGVVRAANSSARGAKGTESVNDDATLAYVDVDDDPLTYNSSRAELAVPAGARVSWARLYWGGNLRVGEQKPPKDNGRVLIAEPGGRYKALLTDTLIGHRTADGADAFQASADVTDLVRSSRPGQWTVAQVNVAMGRSTVGGWGGWTLVAAYEKASEPLRRIGVWDGFETVGPGTGELRVPLDGNRYDKAAAGRLGVIAYDGDRGTPGDYLAVRTSRTKSTRLADSANSADDVMNSSITEFGARTVRFPDRTNTLGYDSDVFDLRGALRDGADRVHVRFGSRKDTVWLGALFFQADVRR
ncbi:MULTISPECIES: DUF3344 domain-containing protein [unclassified Streptomyces]|uniref:DUF3344 domain-containing protein n=1 Tax=unclassified Streptomyces TaxID=2593676 RepID=UPI0006FF1AFA|nr:MULTISPECIES: DUF3344 domain-containing protein [unclassified Streptomyces]KQX58925.1 hypothetical protein ASD33_01030 [Streptomyces sp. Root1304]KRB00186.1 hypothetical protein ASE09_01030 [Streptomyces sp. Root66D1]